jgi:hypothetical protein
MGVFKVVAVALLIYTVALIADARELAHVTPPEGSEAEAAIAGTLHRTSLAIAFLVCLTCGWFTTLAVADFKAVHRRRKLKASIESGRRAVDAAVAAAAEAAGVLAAAELGSRHANDDAEDLAEAVRTARLMAVMARAAAESPKRRRPAETAPEPTLDELVRRAIHVSARRRVS